MRVAARKRFVYPWHIWKKAKSAGPITTTIKAPETSISPKEVEVPKRRPGRPAKPKPPVPPAIKSGDAVFRYAHAHGNTRDVSGRFLVKEEVTEIHTLSGVVGLIDTADLALVSNYAWRGDPQGYLKAYQRGSSGGSKLQVTIHRLLMDAGPNQVVDHINGKTWDNRMANLRIATPQENAWNSRSKNGLRGVKYCPRAKAYTASVHYEGQNHGCGYFDTLQEAIAARDKAVEIIHGKFARFIGSPPPGPFQKKRRANKFSVYKGPYWVAKYEYWQTQISVDGRSKYLGAFKDEIEAAKAYDKAARDIFGEGAVLNFPDKPADDSAPFFLKKFNSRHPKVTPKQPIKLAEI